MRSFECITCTSRRTRIEIARIVQSAQGTTFVESAHSATIRRDLYVVSCPIRHRSGEPALRIYATLSAHTDSVHDLKDRQYHHDTQYEYDNVRPKRILSLIFRPVTHRCFASHFQDLRTLFCRFSSRYCRASKTIN
jgi:hypothetical protein